MRIIIMTIAAVILGSSWASGETYGLMLPAFCL
jgi:hypothetical protein